MKTPRLASWWSDRVIAMRRDKRRTALMGVAYLLGIGWLDYATGYEINLTVVYVTPLIMLTVAGGWRVGLVTALACALTTEMADYLAGRRFDHNVYHVYSVLSHSLSYVSFLFLITQLLMLYDRERDLAGLDGLTGLRNRYGFLARCEEVLARCERRKRRAVMAVWNMARLREVNERHGHEKADAVLKAVAVALRGALPGAELGRLGGDRYGAVFAVGDSRADDVGGPVQGGPGGAGQGGASAAQRPADAEGGWPGDPGGSGPGPAGAERVEGALGASAAELGVALAIRRAVRELPPSARTPEEIAGVLDELLAKSREA
jgi:GGDEF domain-containing protein